LTKAQELNNDHETIESKFYAFYNHILNYWFPDTDGYDVNPQWTIPATPKLVDFTVTVQHCELPLLLVEIKAPSKFHLESGRREAITQIIDRLDDIGPTNQHVQRLYAISAIGKRWRACSIAKGKKSKGGQPVRGVANTASLRSPDPDCWNPDITSDESFTALQGIVERIKGYVA
jgi:hypothetical protein